MEMTEEPRIEFIPKSGGVGVETLVLEVELE
jgi:hypothetical protein